LAWINEIRLWKSLKIYKNIFFIIWR